MKNIDVIKALEYRAWLGLFVDKGRIIDLLLFPISHFLIWGIFLYTDIFSREYSNKLFIINLIWPIAMTIQTQTNKVMMNDLWSREFPELFRSGIDHINYLISLLIFGITQGVINLVIFYIASYYCFQLNYEELQLLLYTFPSYLIFSLALAIFSTSLVIRLNQTYGFIVFSIMTFVVMLSSPYAPIDKIPTWMQPIATYSPLGQIFEYIRFGNSELLYQSLFYSSLLLVLSFFYYLHVFKRLREKGNIFSL